MYRNHTVGVVVTAYNEEEFVGEVIETVPEYVDRVYVVDDGSTDDTWEVVKTTAKRVNSHMSEPPVTETGVILAPRVVPIQMGSNGGVGAAKKAAYRRAREDGVDVVASMDGDGQMDPDDLYRFLDPIVDGHAGFTKGNRLWYRESRVGMPRFRLLGNSVLSFLTKLSSGYFGMVDPQNGYTAISREALLELPLHRMTDRYGFLNDQLACLNVNGVTIADVVHPAKYGEEVSGIDLTGFVPRLSALLLKRFVWRLKNRYLVFQFHPLVFFYLLGTVALVAGPTMGLLTLLSPSAGLTGLGVAGLVTLLGAFSIAMGMTHDVEQNAGNVVHVADEDLAVATAAPTESLPSAGQPVSAQAGPAANDADQQAEREADRPTESETQEDASPREVDVATDGSGTSEGRRELASRPSVSHSEEGGER